MNSYSDLLQQKLADFKIDLEDIDLIYKKDFKSSIKSLVSLRIVKLEHTYNKLNVTNNPTDEEINNFIDKLDEIISDLWIRLLQKHSFLLKDTIKKRFYLNCGSIRILILKINNIINKVDKEISIDELKHFYYNELKESKIKLDEDYKYFKIQMIINAIFSLIGAILGVILSELFKL